VKRILIVLTVSALSACGGVSGSGTNPVSSERTTLAAATAAPTTTRPATLEDLVGTWRTQEAPSFHQYHEDGTYRAAFFLEDLEDDDKVHARGTFTIEGGLFTQIEGDKDLDCKAGERGTYEIWIFENGKVRYFLIEDECDHRASFPVVSMIRLPDSATQDLNSDQP